jgi:hypothetical protein
MKSIAVVTSDSKIWNHSTVHAEIVQAMSEGMPFEINLLLEGPDVRSLGLYDFLNKFSKNLDYDLSDITISTANALEKHDQIKIRYSPPCHLVQLAQQYHRKVTKHKQFKHFGLFIGRSNGPRLHLATHIDKHYRDQSLMSYHWNTIDEFHIGNIGLDDLIKQLNISDVTDESRFLSLCPIRLNKSVAVIIDKSLDSPGAQLLDQDCDYFSDTYKDFFVEIVCETYYSGETFFPTEKIWRPMLLKTPFIVQGPQNYLHNLKKLGFQTFDSWWDEGYAEDPADWQIIEIKKVIDHLAKINTKELFEMYDSMHKILEHNYQLALKLNKQDFLKLNDAK